MFAARPQTVPAGAPRPFSATTSLFLSRMDGDIEERRRAAFIKELRKDPRFKPAMLEPPKPRFRHVIVGGDPIVKAHAARATGLETRRPYKWGQLGSYY